MKSIITKDFGITNAKNFESMITLPIANVYVMVSRSVPWANASNSSLLDDSEINEPYDTVEYKFNVAKDGIILKKITGSDIQPVIPRVDWANGTVYFAYDQSANLFLKISETLISNGNVNVSASNVVANGFFFTNSSPVVSAGDFIRVGEEIKEVVSVNVSGTLITVNSAFSNTYSDNSIYELTYSDVQYINKFYVRNNNDQVFKCLFNANNSLSTVMPEISIDGQLPENPFIETADGYRWKYMYSIPSGLKNKFFNNEYMPVLRDNIVFENAENGRIDIIKILNGGTGYFSGSTTNNYSVVEIVGDGSGANVSVDIVNGVITDINIINGGSNYTTATVNVNDPLQQTIGTDAIFRAIISPPNGHGFDPVRELGASDLMFAVDFSGDMDGLYPTVNDGTDDFRQIAILKDPKFANGAYGTASVYPMYTKIFVSDPPINFSNDQTVYVGSSLSVAVFSAKVVHFDDLNNIIYVNNISGNVDAILTETIYEENSPSVFAKVFSIDKPDINILSGEMLYVENRSKIIRSTDQTETVKLVVEF